MKKISTEWLSVCGGCHVAIVDLHEKIIDILEAVQLCHSPVLTDIKEFPEVDLGILAGAIRTDHDIEVAKQMRGSCDALVAIGTCAVYGGISGAGSVHTRDEIYDTVYRQNKTTVTDNVPGAVPALEETVVPLDHVIDVDLYLPGCPPHASFIFWALNTLAKGRSPKVTHQSVCARCRREMVRTSKTRIKRFLEDKPEEGICFLSQGYPCFGSVTLDRCLSPCPNNGVVCTGCAGPTVQILQEPNRDIRTEIAMRMSMLTHIEEADVLEELEMFSKTHYAYAMASDMIGKKPTFLIKKWINRNMEAAA